DHGDAFGPDGIGGDELAAEAHDEGGVADPRQRWRRRGDERQIGRAHRREERRIVVFDALAGERVADAPFEDVAGASRRLRGAIVETAHQPVVRRARPGTLSVIQLLPPTTAPRPMMVSPPRMVALA